MLYTRFVVMQRQYHLNTTPFGDDNENDGTFGRLPPYPLENKYPRISCHHGSVMLPNNLSVARSIVEKHDNIDILEIDFIVYNENLISSHDFDSSSVLNGSPLKDWIDFVIIEKGLILWIDLKVRLDVWAWIWDHSSYTAHFFFDSLQSLRQYYIETHNIDIRRFIMLTCQDYDTRCRIEYELLHDQRKEIAIIMNHQPSSGSASPILPPRWLLVYDLPFNISYILQYILPKECYSMINTYVYNHFVRYDFSQSTIISIDLSFFDDNINKIYKFIRESNIKEETKIILYNFPLNKEPIKLEGYDIIMQYDYIA